MHALLSSGHAVGFSMWPWDGLYRPVMGCFADGALVAAGSCDLPPEAAAEPASTAFAARLGRRVRRVARLPVSPGSPPLQGPAADAWFRIALPSPVAERLRARDPAVRLERLEDGAPCPPHKGSSDELLGTVESLLLNAQPSGPEPLDGFAAFLSLAPLHQLELVFLEYLRRLPEREARHAYLPRLEGGELTALGLREILIQSDEFRAKRIGLGSRLGANLTGGVWRRICELPSLTARG